MLRGLYLSERGVLRVVFCQAEDGIRDLVRSRGLGDVYKRQVEETRPPAGALTDDRGPLHDAYVGK